MFFHGRADGGGFEGVGYAAEEAVEEGWGEALGEEVGGWGGGYGWRVEEGWGLAAWVVVC